MSRAELLDDIRRSLHLTAAEEQTLRAAAPLLEPEVAAWVDAFYVRLVADPAAMALLEDEGRILRLKRSLAAWFHELFALPLDAAYARAREEIGRTHLRIGMPAYLMVTSMSHLKADVRRSALRRLAAEPERAERVARAAEKHLDLELSMMLSTYAQRGRQVERQRDRTLLLEVVARGLLGGVHDTTDAALCYLELLRNAVEPALRARWAARLAGLLRRLAQGDARGLATLAALDDAPQRVPLAALVDAALDGLAPGDRARVEVRFTTRQATALLRPAPLQQALTEVLAHALGRGTHRAVALGVREEETGGLLVEVTDAGPSRPGARVRTHPSPGGAPGSGLAFAELVASLHGGELQLFPAPNGGEGVRLRLDLAAGA